MLTYHQTTENEKYEINDWKYSGDYAIYNNPPYEEQKKTGRGFANPDYCSKGYGQQMTQTAWEISRQLFPDKPMYLEVRTWNKRAVRCYEKAGFHIVGDPIHQATSAGDGVFYHMIREA